MFDHGSFMKRAHTTFEILLSLCLNAHVGSKVGKTVLTAPPEHVRQYMIANVLKQSAHEDDGTNAQPLRI